MRHHRLLKVSSKCLAFRCLAVTVEVNGPDKSDGHMIRLVDCVCCGDILLIIINSTGPDTARYWPWLYESPANSLISSLYQYENNSLFPLRFTDNEEIRIRRERKGRNKCKVIKSDSRDATLSSALLSPAWARDIPHTVRSADDFKYQHSSCELQTN